MPPSSGRCGRTSWRATASRTRAWTSPPRPTRPPAGPRRPPTPRCRARPSSAATPTLVRWLSDRLLAIAGERAGESPRRSASGAGPGGVFADARLFDPSRLPGRRCGSSPARERPEPGRPRRVGGLGERDGAPRPRPAALRRRLGGPRRVHQPRRVRPRLRRRRPAAAGTSATTNPDGLAAAHGDHRVHQRRHAGRAGLGQPRRGPVRGLRRVLGRHVARTARSATSSTARCACSASWPRTPTCKVGSCCTSPATPARRPPRTAGPTSGSSSRASCSSSPRATSSSSTRGSTTRSRCCWRRRFAHGRADRGAAPHPPADRDPGPRGAGDAVASRGRPRRVRAARVPRRTSRGAARSSSAARCPPRTSWRCFPELDRRGLNVRVVAAQSEELFRLQDAGLPRRRRVRRPTGSTRWSSPTAPSGSCATGRRARSCEDYSLGADWDDRWRTGGSVDEVIEEAHLDQGHILAGIERFVRERELRLGSVRSALEAASRS